MKPETLMEWGALPKQGSMIADWAKTILALYPTVTPPRMAEKGSIKQGRLETRTNPVSGGRAGTREL